MRVEKTHGRIYCFVDGRREEVIEESKKVFGIVSISPSLSCDLDMNLIGQTALEVIKSIDYKGKTFKVRDS